MKEFSVFFSAVLGLLLASPGGHAETVYDNSTTRLGLSLQSANEYGDEIILAGTARTVTNFQFFYYATNFSGDEQARIRFYTLDGPANSLGVPTPQTLIFDSGFFAVSNTPSQTSSITLPRLKVTVPDTFVWSVIFTGVTSPPEEGGLQLYSPPTIGTNYPDFWEHALAGWELRELPGRNVDFGAKIDATASSLDNTAPFIGIFADQTVPKNASIGPLPFTVGDLESDPADLTVSASSSDLALVPVENIIFGGSGRDRTVTITPVANLAGAATITLFVQDPSGAVDSRSFILRVGPPTITAIADQTIAEDAVTAALPFTINDQETVAENLLVVANSSNPTLLPPNAILLAGQGSNRTIQLLPPTNQFGASLITISVTDEIGATASTTFQLQVTSVNDLPTISDIGPQTEAGVRFPFTISDVETPAENLMLSGSSSNQALVPDGNIIFAGNGTARTVTINPLPGQSGSALIRVTVTDANRGSALDEFLFTIQANTLPRIAEIPDQTVESGRSTAPIDFIIGDAQTPADSLTLSANSSDTVLIPTENIVFGGSGSNRTVVITAPTNQFGSAQITVIVTDANGGSASETFQVTVVSTAQGAPQISVQPQSQTRPLGEGVVFTVIASGAGPLTYQWRFNGNDIPNGTNSVLTINNLTAAQAGVYAVRVANLFGSTISSNAVLSVGAQLALGSPGFSNGRFSFGVNGPASRRVAIEASSNLVNWTRVATNTVGTVFIDPSATPPALRFYRATLLP